MKARIVFFVLLAATAAVLSVGCGGKQIMQINPRVTSWEMLAKKAPDATYVVEPPDAISIESPTDPSLNRTVQLRQDGTVTLPYLEDVKVAGLTTIQIREKLEEMYARFYREPKLLVSVASYASKKIYLYGEVGRQGSIPYTGYTTVSEVIGQVGGVTTRAAWTRVRVIRGDPENPEVIKVNLRDMILEGDLSQEVSLAENDIVRVPPTVLAWTGYQIESLLFPFRSIISAAWTSNQVRSLDQTF